MDDSEDTEPKETAEPVGDQPLILDGTVNLDDSTEDEVPRVKGLIELIGRYLDD